jgi:hypothetical protein
MSSILVERPVPTAGPTPATPVRSGPSAADAVLVLAVATLLAFDLVGGLIAINADLNTVGEAWGSEALLAAPIPMMAGQLVLTTITLAFRGRTRRVSAGILALACGISVTSVFFDGAVENPALDARQHAFQITLLAVTAVVAVVAGRRAVTRR